MHVILRLRHGPADIPDDGHLEVLHDIPAAMRRDLQAQIPDHDMLHDDLPHPAISIVRLLPPKSKNSVRKDIRAELHRRLRHPLRAAKETSTKNEILQIQTGYGINDSRCKDIPWLWRGVCYSMRYTGIPSMPRNTIDMLVVLVCLETIQELYALRRVCIRGSTQRSGDPNEVIPMQAMRSGNSQHCKHPFRTALHAKKGALRCPCDMQIP